MNADCEMTMMQHNWGIPADYAEIAANKERERRKPILCLDFDGVLHSYISGWKGARCIPDPPVEGALEFLREAVRHFNVQIFSSRSHQWGGRRAMKKWLWFHLKEKYGDEVQNGHFVFCAEDVYYKLKWPRHKPPASVSLDDRGLLFTGKFPSTEELKAFQPYWK